MIVGLANVVGPQALGLVTTVPGTNVLTLPSPSPQDIYLPPPTSPRHLVGAALASGALALFESASALAQTPQAAESVLPTVSHLPPTWQIVAGVLLYAVPAARAVTRLFRKVAAHFLRQATPLTGEAAPERRTLVDKVNRATGRIERWVALFRDPLTVPGAIGLLASLGPEQPVASLAVSAVALGLATFSFLDGRLRVNDQLIGRQMKTGQVLTPEGRKHQRADALGFLGRDVPQRLPDEDTLGEMLSYGQGVKETTSKVPNALGLLELEKACLGAHLRHGRLEGLRTALATYRHSLRSVEILPVSPQLLEEADVLLAQWAMRYARVNRTTVRFEGLDELDRIPEGAPIVFAGFPHSSIYTDFLAVMRLPRLRFLADRRNFHDNILSRRLGLASFLDLVGFSYVDRSGENVANPKYADLAEELEEKIRLHRIQPVFFLQGGRIPRAYKNDGKLDKPGFYANVVDPANPAEYAKAGVISNAAKIADRTGKTVYVPLLQIEGASFVMPKMTRKFPFYQPNTTGQTITYRIAGVMEVGPGADKRKSFQELIRLAKEASGINALLQERVRRWATEFSRKTFGTVGSDFVTVAESDERFYIIADRIRSIPPSDRRRQLFKIELLDIIDAAPHYAEHRLASLLKHVSQVVKEVEYQT